MKNLLIFLAKLAITMAIFAYLYTKVDIAEVAIILKRTDLFYAVLSLLATIIAVCSMGWRWRAICSHFSLKESFFYFTRLQFIGLWFNQVLPGGIGGDAVKMLALRRHFGKGTGAIVTTLFDRLSGLMMIVVFVALSLPLSYKLFGAHPLFYLFILMALGGIAGFIVLLNLYRFKILEKHKILKWLLSISKSAHKVFWHSKETFLTAIWTSVIVQGLGVVNFYLAALALGIEVQFWQMFTLIPPVFLLLIVPISLAGWGLREGVVVGLFTMTGLMTSTEALSVSLLYGLLLIVSAIPGSIFLLLKHKKEASEETLIENN